MTRPLYRRDWAVTDATVALLSLHAVGHVSWWRPGSRDVTLHRVLVHVIAETRRHAGHADIVRELIDGAGGLRDGSTSLPDVDAAWWTNYRHRLEAAARAAGGD